MRMKSSGPTMREDGGQTDMMTGMFYSTDGMITNISLIEFLMI